MTPEWAVVASILICAVGAVLTAVVARWQMVAGAEELLARPVTTATHRVPLSALALYAGGLGVRAWLLGVQPASLGQGDALSPAVAGTLDALVQLLGSVVVGGEGVAA